MHVLDETDALPIVAWKGPAHDDITEKTMADLAEGGWNISLSYVDPDKMRRQLDIARGAGVRLIVGLPDLRVGPGTVDEAWKNQIIERVHQIRDHEGLYGYYIADEPRRKHVEDIMRIL